MSEDYQTHSEVVDIFQGGDLIRIAELEAAVNVATIQSGGNRRIGSRAPTDETKAAVLSAARAYDEFVEEAGEERAHRVTVEALPRKDWRALRKKYPPRPAGDGVSEDEAEQDKAFGFNVDELSEELVPQAVVSVTRGGKPAFTGAGDMQKWFDRLPDGEFQKIASAAVRVNIDDTPAPKADLSSRLSRIFAETSKSPDDSD